MNKVLAALVPPAVVTSTLRVPAVPAGVLQVTDVAVLALSEVHGLPSMLTPVALLKLAPVIVTLLPPAAGPEVGLIAVAVGAPTKEYKVLSELVPPAVVT